MTSLGRIPVSVSIVSLTLVALLIFAALYPHPWLWGVNWWSGLSVMQVVAGIVAVAIVCALSFVLLRIAERRDASGTAPISQNSADNFWTITVIAAAILVPLLGWFFRAESFVLGDGYAVIGNLQLVEPIIKARNYGGSLFPLILNDLLPGDPPTRAQLAYQLTSVGAGILYVLAVAFACTVLFKSLRERLILYLLLLTSGNMLLYFGYAENYPLFHVNYLLACVFGYRFIRDERPRDAIWFVVTTMIALATHIFAVSLIPAAFGALFPFVARKLKWKKVPGPRLSATVAVLVSFAGALSMYLLDDFARLSFLPIFPNEFTADGYTLFAPRHLADAANLIIMLIPGLPILLIHRKLSATSGERQFLLFVTLTGFSLAFWVNPWLGMPRDWDLLSFWMIPFVLWAASRFHSDKQLFSIPLVIAAVALNSMLLVPRVIANTDRAIMWNHFESYFSQDTMRNMKFRVTQTLLMREQGFEERALKIEQELKSIFPEIEMTRSAQSLSARGRHDLAIQQCRAAIARNPMLSDAYNNLALGQIGIGQLDSAKRNLDIASAFNPYSPDIINNYAVVAYNNSKFEEAEELFNNSLIYNPENLIARLNLLHVAFSLNDSSRARKYSQWLRGRTDIPPQESVETITNLAKLGLNDLAREFLQSAVQRGMDTSSARMLIERYPGLR